MMAAMPRILITSGPTREFLDPVRFLSNASSGRMGAALAREALRRGYEVVIVSGPVAVDYPPAARVISVVTTDEMLEGCLQVFSDCDGTIAAAAPCDFRPEAISERKIVRSDAGLTLKLRPTPDIIGTLGRLKQSQQWTVAFALETQAGLARAADKLRRKGCDLIVVNDPATLDSPDARVVLLDREGHTRSAEGSKDAVAAAILEEIERRVADWRIR
jgi:phosphopantothenoylcysteine decarboxylase/phosphopantothenate--cysteine ligase